MYKRREKRGTQKNAEKLEVQKMPPARARSEERRMREKTQMNRDKSNGSSRFRGVIRQATARRGKRADTKNKHENKNFNEGTHPDYEGAPIFIRIGNPAADESRTKRRPHQTKPVADKKPRTDGAESSN